MKHVNTLSKQSAAPAKADLLVKEAQLSVWQETISTIEAVVDLVRNLGNGGGEEA